MKGQQNPNSPLFYGYSYIVKTTILFLYKTYSSISTLKYKGVYMKSFSFIALVLFSQLSFALSERVITREVTEEIRKGKILGVKYVDELKFISCTEALCDLSFTYQTSGCHWEMCYDLECSGTLTFDQEELTTDVKEQECIDL